MIKAPTRSVPLILWAKTKRRVNSLFDRPRRSILDRSWRPRSSPHWRSKHHRQLRRTCRRWNHRRWSSHWKMPIWKKEYPLSSPRRSSDDQLLMWVIEKFLNRMWTDVSLMIVCVAERWSTIGCLKPSPYPIRWCNKARIVTDRRYASAGCGRVSCGRDESSRQGLHCMQAEYHTRSPRCRLATTQWTGRILETETDSIGLATGGRSGRSDATTEGYCAVSWFWSGRANASPPNVSDWCWSPNGYSKSFVLRWQSDTGRILSLVILVHLAEKWTAATRRQSLHDEVWHRHANDHLTDSCFTARRSRYIHRSCEESCGKWWNILQINYSTNGVHRHTAIRRRRTIPTFRDSTRRRRTERWRKSIDASTEGSRADE